MSKTLIRLVGGDSAGQEVWHDPDAQGPIIRMAVHPDFNVCDKCVTADMPVEATFHQEEYLIHLIRFDTNGHRHYYAAPPRQKLVDIMNQLWDGYRTDADMERRNGH